MLKNKIKEVIKYIFITYKDLDPVLTGSIAIQLNGKSLNREIHDIDIKFQKDINIDIKEKIKKEIRNKFDIVIDILNTKYEDITDVIYETYLDDIKIKYQSFETVIKYKIKFMKELLSYKKHKRDLEYFNIKL